MKVLAVLVLALLCGAFADVAFSSEPAPGSTIAFADTTVGANSTSTLNIINSGSDIMSYGDVAFSNKVFSTSTLGAMIGPNTTAPIVITCTPTAAGVATGNLTLTTSDPDFPSVMYVLTCTGVAADDPDGPEFVSVPAAGSEIDFPTTYVDYSNTEYIVVENQGDEDLSLSDYAFDDAHFSTTASAATIAAGANTSIPIMCSPSASGTVSGKFSLSTNDPNMATVSYDLVCKAAVAPILLSTPVPFSEIHFGHLSPEDDGSASLKIWNNGSSDLVINTPTINSESQNGESKSGYLTFSSDFPATLSNGESIEVELDCTAPSSTGLLTAYLTVTSNDPAKPTITYTLACWSVKATSSLAIGFGVLIVFTLFVAALVAVVFFKRAN